MADINTIINANQNAKDATKYVDAIVLDEEQIEETNYRMVWTENYSGGYPPVNEKRG